MTDVEYKLFRVIKSIYGKEHSSSDHKIWFAASILGISYMIFFLSLANTNWFGDYLTLTRVVSGLVFLATAIWLFMLAKNIGEYSAKVKITTVVLRKAKKLLEEYQFDNKDIEQFKSDLNNVDTYATKKHKEAIYQMFGALNILVFLPFITFISNAILRSFSDNKAQLDIGAGINLFLTILLAAALIAISEYAVSGAIFAFYENQHQVVVHILENLIYLSAKGISIKRFSELLADTDDGIKPSTTKYRIRLRDTETGEVHSFETDGPVEEVDD